MPSIMAEQSTKKGVCLVGTKYFRTHLADPASFNVAHSNITIVCSPRALFWHSCAGTLKDLGPAKCVLNITY